MLKRELSEGIIEYIFPGKEGEIFSNRITALINENKVFLIDSGYDFQMKEVIRDLDENSLIVEGVIITHFHSDHMEGLKSLRGKAIYGNSNYQKTLDRWYPVEEHKYFTPTVCISDNFKIEFGIHKIEIIPFPGHSICTNIIKINEKYIHVADEIMFSSSGEPLLPSVTKEGVKRHRDSVNRLKDYLDYTFIMSHGESSNGKKKIKDIIEDILMYFDKILNSSQKVSFEEATQECKSKFIHTGWHQNVYK